MNWKKLILLSYVAPAVFAISTSMAAPRMMQSAPMHGVHRSSAVRASIMTNSATRFNRFNRFNDPVVFNDRFHRFNSFNDPVFFNDRFHRFRRFNEFVFVDFGFPFFAPSFFTPFPYYYPYDYYDYGNYDNAYGGGSIVVQVQSRLAQAGYYRGAIDGVMGPRTRAAIATYERDHGMRVDGVISNRLLGTMGLRY